MVNDLLDPTEAKLVADKFGFDVEIRSVEGDVLEEEDADTGTRVLRPPVVTVMGHVDHGKTSLLDAIRKSKVAEKEFGGITQHIGAYQVMTSHGKVTFLDTPGHEAFTAMRARGAQATDIVILVVAADDGVMPQTQEAINHARAANVPIIVAVNKIDKPEADPDRVKRELANLDLVPEDWGGQTIFVPTSAKKGTGIEQLLEMTALQSEILELKANPNRAAKGVIIESRLDRGRGPVATALIQNGTLKEGDAIVVGAHSGRIRALIDPTGKKVASAGPSDPVEVLGLSGVPSAGDVIVAVSDERKARQIATMRADRAKGAGKASTRITLEGLQKQIQTGEVKELRLILKADVQGSVEALAQSLEQLSTEEVKLKVIHSSVGAINESDVMLASASGAIVLGFNVKAEPKASQQAQANGVDLRAYNVIYEAINDLKAALAGMLAPEIRETIIGRAEVRQIFVISKLGPIAGSYVAEGKIVRGAKARVKRGDSVFGTWISHNSNDTREIFLPLTQVPKSSAAEYPTAPTPPKAPLNQLECNDYTAKVRAYNAAANDWKVKMQDVVQRAAAADAQIVATFIERTQAAIRGAAPVQDPVGTDIYGGLAVAGGVFGTNPGKHKLVLFSDMTDTVGNPVRPDLAQSDIVVGLYHRDDPSDQGKGQRDWETTFKTLNARTPVFLPWAATTADKIVEQLKATGR